MPNELQVWNFEDAPVRTSFDDKGNPLWVAADVCRAIGIKNQGNAYKRLDPDEKVIHTTDTPGGPQEMMMVNEPGLYNLVMGSKQERAKQFRKWITSEVLPAIRKTGKYEISPDLPYDPNDKDSVILYNMLQSRRQILAVQREQELQWENIKHSEMLALEASSVAETADAKATEALDTINGNTDMVAIVGYCSRKGINISERQSSRVGGALTRYCKFQGINYGSARDGYGAHNERWDGVNKYPREVLDLWRSGEIAVPNLDIVDDVIHDHSQPVGRRYC